MDILKSKVFWINVLSILILIINAAIQQQIIPLKYVAYAGLAVTAITDIVALIQNQSLKGKVAKLEAKK